ncbi:hypothetical protein BX616_001578 [Lobosporangium transversale]|nr:hypothetical protein BX616_001578 [Lobosporangium transversale]
MNFQQQRQKQQQRYSKKSMNIRTTLMRVRKMKRCEFVNGLMMVMIVQAEGPERMTDCWKKKEMYLLTVEDNVAGTISLRPNRLSSSTTTILNRQRRDSGFNFDAPFIRAPGRRRHKYYKHHYKSYERYENSQENYHTAIITTIINSPEKEQRQFIEHGRGLDVFLLKHADHGCGSCDDVVVDQ